MSGLIGWGFVAGGGACLLIAVAYVYALRKRNMHLWMGAYYFSSRQKAKTLDCGEPVHVFIAVCDHYEPEWGKPSKAASVAKVQRWVDEYPRLFDQFRDSSGRPPQHTCFYPQDEYQPEYLDLLAELVHRSEERRVGKECA